MFVTNLFFPLLACYRKCLKSIFLIFWDSKSGSILIIQHPIFLKKSPCMLYFVKIEAFLSLMIIDILQMFGEVPSLMGINTFFFYVPCTFSQFMHCVKQWSVCTLYEQQVWWDYCNTEDGTRVIWTLSLNQNYPNNAVF